MPSCSTKLGLAAPTTKKKDCCQPKRRTEAEALEDVSARMLQGWTMLGDACPVAGCNTPLVRSRQGEVWCARCGAAVVKEGDAMAVPSSPPSTTEVAQKARAAWAEAAARDDDDEHEETASSPRARPGWAVEAAEADGEDVVITQRKPRDAKARDAASAAIGQKLLSGWTLLDEACGRCTVGVPLMRDTNQRKFCVACDAYEDDAVAASAPSRDEGEDWRKFIVEEPAEDPLAVPLSEHLVKGYVLLGKQCPAKDCPSPLMRAPDGREVCVQPACVAAQMLEEDDDDEDFVVDARNDDEVRLPPPVPGASALGAHLIRGYAMLEDICPNAGCNSPLMRSPDGADRCLFLRSSRGPMDTASPS